MRIFWKKWEDAVLWKHRAESNDNIAQYLAADPRSHERTVSAVKGRRERLRAWMTSRRRRRPGRIIAR